MTAYFAERLGVFLEVEKSFVPGGLSIGLNAPYGSGKSTFLSLWKDSIEKIQDDQANDKTPKNLVVILDAWESDYYGDPLFAIVSNLIEALGKGDASDKERAEKFKEGVKDLGWFLTGAGGIATRVLTLGTIDPLATGEFAEKKKAERKEKSEEGNRAQLKAFELYEGRKSAMKGLKDLIKDFIKDNNINILFLVDELDRCRPDYAISFLETIKHIFDIKGTTFVLAVDRDHLKNSAKTAFGEHLAFDNYYQKFVHRELSLPPLSPHEKTKMYEGCFSYFLEKSGYRQPHKAVYNKAISYSAKLMSESNMTPRDTQFVYRVIGHLFSTGTNSSPYFLDRDEMTVHIFMAINKFSSESDQLPQDFNSFSKRQDEILFRLTTHFEVNLSESKDIEAMLNNARNRIDEILEFESDSLYRG